MRVGVIPMGKTKAVPRCKPAVIPPPRVSALWSTVSCKTLHLLPGGTLLELLTYTIIC